MDARELDRVWNRARRGLHTVVTGRLPTALEAPDDLLILRVRCDGPPRLLGPLLEAAARAARWMGESPPRLDAPDAVSSGGARGGMLDDGAAEPRALAVVVATLNRLARRVARGGAVLVLEQFASADEATVAAVRAMLERPGWLALPLVLALGASEPSDTLQPVVSAAVGDAGREAVVRAMAAPDPAAWREPFARLGAEVKLTLRAAAMMGSGFDATTVAALRGLAPASVLEQLQQAIDEGMPVEDTGDGLLRLPDALTAALRGSTLPALAHAWHRRLATLFAPDLVDAPRAPEAAGPTAAAAVRQPAPSSPVAPQVTAPVARAAFEPPVRRAAPRIRLARHAHPAALSGAPDTSPRPQPAPQIAPPRGSYAELFEASTKAPTPAEPPPSLVAVPQPSASPAASPPRMRIVPPPASADESEARDDAPAEPFADDLPAHGSDHARAAEHLLAAGDYDAAAERFATAAVDIAQRGLPAQACAYARRALDTLARLPHSPARRQLRVEILCALGQLQRQAAGPGTEFTLAASLATLESARELLTDDDPAELRALLLSELAATRYELGDLGSLSAALDELTVAIRALATAGDATGAARLLNDQAAVYVRLGDPVRAAHLLAESRRVFEARAEHDPLAMCELAQTDHLFARLPLHVPARTGREAEALEMARRHAAAAAQVYERLELRRELARVWETAARIELRAGLPERAEERLNAAMQVQETVGDVLGLARSTAAMADALARMHRVPEALVVLSSSVAFNLEKGSPIGLAYNRRALERLAGGAAESGAQTAHRAAMEQLAAAEQIVGRADLRDG